jgi:hypothetical protein
VDVRQGIKPGNPSGILKVLSRRIFSEFNMTKTLYLGIDPDLRCLNMAVLDGTTPLAIFLRRNKEGKGDTAVASAVKGIAGILDDFVKFMASNETLQTREIVMIVESQNMMQAAAYRGKGKKIDYQDILHTGQLSGIWMGVFADVATRVHLVQPSAWKGQIPKSIHHPRIYAKLGWPVNTPPDSLGAYSSVKPNPGDFLDINDSLGLALWGAERGL